GSRVRVSSVHPGAVATRIVTDGRFRAGGNVSPERARELIARGMPPERAAEIVVEGVRENRRRILVGEDARALARLHRLMPTHYRDVLGWFTRLARDT